MNTRLNAAAQRATVLSAVPALAKEIGRNAAERELARILPHDGFALFRESGLGRLRIPVEYGGLGGSLEELFEIVTTLAAEESNVAHALRTHFDTTEWLYVSAPAPFLERQIDRIVGGALFGGGSTERGTAKPGQVTTQLVRDGAHFRLSGKKYYTTGTAFSDFVRFNVLDEHGTAASVILPRDREGIEVVDDWDGMGQRMTASGTTVLTNVIVYPEEVWERGYTTLAGRHGGALRQLHLVATAAGIVRRIVSDAEDYVLHHGRAALHSTAALAREDAFIQQVIGELGAHRHAIDALVRENARALGVSAEAIRHNAPDAEALVLQSALATARTQLIVSKLALHAGERLFEAGGASATSRIYNFDRHWRNLRTLFSHNPLSHKARVLGDYALNGTTTHLIEGRVF
ncbi:alkylation response protein AidB-like acyl-CoA dehydrogenase [Robbsia andropogonis]|uniref:acyl-CoA dehydrogenase family protein n=1 Tax=Robbsia andropogonis TaxID=28092 RepID=UPI003D1CE5F9